MYILKNFILTIWTDEWYEKKKVPAQHMAEEPDLFSGFGTSAMRAVRFELTSAGWVRETLLRVKLGYQTEETQHPAGVWCGCGEGAVSEDLKEDEVAGWVRVEGKSWGRAGLGSQAPMGTLYHHESSFWKVGIGSSAWSEGECGQWEIIREWRLEIVILEGRLTRENMVGLKCRTFEMLVTWIHSGINVPCCVYFVHFVSVSYVCPNTCAFQTSYVWLQVYMWLYISGFIYRGCP